jgi:ribonuclease I
MPQGTRAIEGKDDRLIKEGGDWRKKGACSGKRRKSKTPAVCYRNVKTPPAAKRVASKGKDGKRQLPARLNESADSNLVSSALHLTNC